jgi:hypothetical protein
VVSKKGCPQRGTEGSNLPPSSGESGANPPGNQKQDLDERLGSPLGWQAIRARCALSDAAEPHLSRQSYPGEHAPIIEQPLWEAVQAQLAGNAAGRHSGAQIRQPSLLAELLFDGDGNRMTPSQQRIIAEMNRPVNCLTMDITPGLQTTWCR